MKNKSYLEEIHNMNKNYEKILQKMRGVMNMKKKMLNIAAIFVVVLLVGATSSSLYAKIKWNIEFEEYQNRPVGEAKGNLDEVRESDYAEVLNMDYVTQDGVSIKVDSLLLTDDCFDANVSFQFAEDKKLNSQTFRYGFAVYDENKNIYGIFSRTRVNDKRDNTTPFIYKELGIKYNKNDIFSIQLNDSAGFGPVEVNKEERKIITNLNIRAKDVFPQSKKIYIQIFDLGYDMYDMSSINEKTHTIDTKESFDITDAKWFFEINVPEKFYERNTTELKLDQEIPGFEIEKATISETGLVLIFKSQAYRDLITNGKDMIGKEFTDTMNAMFHITNGEGKVYQEISGGTRDEKSYKATFDAGMKDWEKKLFVNFMVDGKTYTSELIAK